MIYVNVEKGYIPDYYDEEDKDLVEIDDLMVPAILELNKKGYITTNCCSGHYITSMNSYIMFDSWIRLPSIPEGWSYESDNNIIRFNYNDNPWFQVNNIYDFYLRLISVMESLHEWAKSLDHYRMPIEMQKVKRFLLEVKIQYEDLTKYFIEHRDEHISIDYIKSIMDDVYLFTKLFLAYYYNITQDLYNTGIYFQVIKEYVEKHFFDRNVDILDHIVSLYNYDYRRH